MTAKLVAQSAGRALGLLIAKFKSLGGMPFDVYSKLYDSLVWPVIAYGAALWVDRTFACIDVVQSRAMRFYLGVGIYTPTAAVTEDMGLELAIVKQWKCVGNFWYRLCNMNNSRLTKKFSYIVSIKMINVKTGHTEYPNLKKKKKKNELQ